MNKLKVLLAVTLLLLLPISSTIPQSLQSPQSDTKCSNGITKATKTIKVIKQSNQSKSNQSKSKSKQSKQRSNSTTTIIDEDVLDILVTSDNSITDNATSSNTSNTTNTSNTSNTTRSSNTTQSAQQSHVHYLTSKEIESLSVSELPYPIKTVYSGFYTKSFITVRDVLQYNYNVYITPYEPLYSVSATDNSANGYFVCYSEVSFYKEIDKSNTTDTDTTTASSSNSESDKGVLEHDIPSYVSYTVDCWVIMKYSNNVIKTYVVQ